MLRSHLSNHHDAGFNGGLTFLFGLEARRDGRCYDHRHSGACSDALGIHVSEEAENVHTAKEVWEATLATFLAKFLFALTFLVPVVLFELSTAILIGMGYGFFLLALLSYAIAKDGAENSWKVVAEHLVIALIVVVLTHEVGDWISATFG